MAGLSGEFENGLMAMELDSAVTSDFARGASGSADESFDGSEATAFEATGESVVAGFGRSEFGSQNKRSAADSNKEHLRVAAVMKLQKAATWEG